MRILLQFSFLLLTASSCFSVKKLNTALEQPIISIGLSEPLANPFSQISIPTGIEVDSVFAPSGFVPQSFGSRTGVLIIPFLIYNRFQSNYLITLGAKQFNKPINDSFKERFSMLLVSCEDSSRVLQKQKYKLTLDLQSCQTEGIYVHGSWSVIYGYGSVSGVIDRGRNASSFVRLRWELSEERQSVVGGNVMVTLKDPYIGKVKGYLTTNGHRKELIEADLNYGIPFSVIPMQGMNPLHLLDMVTVFCLSLDEASEAILRDIEKYFSNP